MNDDEYALHLRDVARIAGIDPARVVLPRHHFFQSTGLRLHYLEWGPPAGYPLVLLHGGSLTAHTWSAVCMALPATYRCIAPDLRGHGDSDWAPNGAYSLDMYRADLAALIEHLGFERWSAVGNSLGGMTALRYTAQCAPDARPEALVLVDVGPEMREVGRRRLRAFTNTDRELDSVEAFVERAVAFNPARDRLLLRRSLRNNLRQLPSGKWTWKWDPRRFESLSRVGDALSVSDRWQDVHRVVCPTLVVRGGNSDMFHDEDAEKLAATLPDGQWLRIEGAGHTVQGDQPVALARAVQRFLAAVVTVA